MLLTCREISDTTTDLLEGPTTLTQRVKLRFHLMMCVHCRRYLRQLRHAIGVAQDISSPPEPSEAEIETLVSRLKG